jgi:hypothetical protein
MAIWSAKLPPSSLTGQLLAQIRRSAPNVCISTSKWGL